MIAEVFLNSVLFPIVNDEARLAFFRGLKISTLAV